MVLSKGKAREAAAGTSTSGNHGAAISPAHDSSIRQSGISTLPPLPTPYEYLLMSDAAYFDKPEESPRYAALSEKGWICISTIEESSGYRGSLWQNDKTKQLVVAHRGSQNIESWVTDLESVVNKQKGDFIYNAISVMEREEVRQAKESGYRISTTGHSLGGFLAQVCVYWAQRSEFSETYCPEMSAMVFDSPGAVEFLKLLDSTLESRKVNMGSLNIHNFCAMPTLVSTYGTHTGTVWQVLNQPGIVRLGIVDTDFVTAHSLDVIAEGFSPETGEPKEGCRAMASWPRASYSEYKNVGEFLGQISVQAKVAGGLGSLAKFAGLKLAIDSLNSLYKKLTGSVKNRNLYDQIFTSPKGGIYDFLRETEEGRMPTLEEFGKKLQFAIGNQYARQQKPMRKMSLHHFDEDTQQFLEELKESQRFESLVEKVKWKEALEERYGKEGAALLGQFRIEKQGDTAMLVIGDTFSGGVFSFQQQLQALTYEKGLIYFKEFFADFLVRHQDEPSIHATIAAVATKAGAKARATNVGLAKQDIIDIINKTPLKELDEESNRWIVAVASAVATEPEADAEVTNYFGSARPSEGAPKEKPSTTDSIDYVSYQKESLRGGDDVFHVSIKYAGLGKVQISMLQDLLESEEYGTQAFSYIEGSVEKKKGSIVKLSFEDEASAVTLKKAFSAKVAELKREQQQFLSNPSEEEKSVVESNPEDCDTPMQTHNAGGRNLLSIEMGDDNNEVELLQTSSASRLLPLASLLSVVRSGVDVLTWPFLASSQGLEFKATIPAVQSSYLSEESSSSAAVVVPESKSVDYRSGDSLDINPMGESDKSGMSCQSGFYGEERMPALECGNEHFKSQVFLKREATAISTQIEPSSCVGEDGLLTGDTYDQSTCHPVEHFGQPSVSCEGEKTHLIYTPRIANPFFETLNANLLLGTVLLHAAKQGYDFVMMGAEENESAISQESSDIIATDSAAVQQLFKELRKELSGIQQLVADKQSKDTHKGFPWARDALEFHTERLAELEAKSSVAVSHLQEIKLDVEHLKAEVQVHPAIIEQTPSAQTMPSIHPTNVSHLENVGMFASGNLALGHRQVTSVAQQPALPQVESSQSTVNATV